ncbi:hypothetical protein KIN20_001696 [Parelaphostrongylus tenuis]|uniref:Uncharacterized protein n=1 Tax=Parelaphostrongylus tenuis TaxID=148309 RepID=A0AAD5QGB3_PARTN|nr:hypothetical protein KIN20_001696 [Parelaphostrongylus tenuis]
MAESHRFVSIAYSGLRSSLSLQFNFRSSFAPIMLASSTSFRMVTLLIICRQ